MGILSNLVNSEAYTIKMNRQFTGKPQSKCTMVHFIKKPFTFHKNEYCAQLVHNDNNFSAQFCIKWASHIFQEPLSVTVTQGGLGDDVRQRDGHPTAGGLILLPLPRRQPRGWAGEAGPTALLGRASARL